MTKALTAFLPIVFIWFSAIAQNFPHRCFTTEAVRMMDERNPGYAEAVEQAFQEAKRHADQAGRSQDIYRIPVVFHIVYNTEAGNIPDNLVEEQVAVLNEDFRRMNADAADTRAEFLPVAADAGIEFYLATEDPDGNPTTGITRTQTSRTSFLSLANPLPDDIKRSAEGGKDAWDTERYLNIWVGSLSLFGVPFILGYAYPPAGTPNWPDGQGAPDPGLEGVVIHYQVFSRNNPLSTGLLETNSGGRTCTHEVGHYLGLRHTWGDGGGFTGQDGCTVDDGIADTPNCKDAQQQQCNLSSNTCTDSPTDLPDQIENYMDYSDERCLNMFTQGQVAMMRTVLETSRNGLVTVSPASLPDLSRSPEVRMFPNPTEGRVTVSWGSPARVSITVSDALGRVVEAQSLHSVDRADLRLNSLPPGIYTVLLHSAEWQTAERLVVR